VKSLSLPTFPNPKDIPNLKKSLSAIVTSIAMEEEALALIMKAESEKINYAIKQGFSKEDLLAVNDSVSSLLGQINNLQLILKEKLRIALDHLPRPPKPRPPCPPKPPCPPHPPCPPCPPCPEPVDDCISIFSPWTSYLWRKNSNLRLFHECRCPSHHIKMKEGQIFLPKEGRGYYADLMLSLSNPHKQPGHIQLTKTNLRGEEVFSKSYKISNKSTIEIYDKMYLREAGLLSIKLISSQDVGILDGYIKVTKQ